MQYHLGIYILISIGLVILYLVVRWCRKSKTYKQEKPLFSGYTEASQLEEAFRLSYWPQIWERFEPTLENHYVTIKFGDTSITLNWHPTHYDIALLCKNTYMEYRCDLDGSNIIHTSTGYYAKDPEAQIMLFSSIRDTLND
jgi:hypothetical protein